MSNGLKSSLKPYFDQMPEFFKNGFRSARNKVNKLRKQKPTFSGWGMDTYHSLPWENNRHSQVFLKSIEDMKSNFMFYKDQGVAPDNLDHLNWRHWVITEAVRYAIRFTKVKKFSFSECGVCIGISAFFLLRELEHAKSKGEIESFQAHLYDSWDVIRTEELSENEQFLIGKYAGISLEDTRKNLEEFKDEAVFHPGYIPESFLVEPVFEGEIGLLHIDLNASKPSIDSLKHFYPKLVKGGVIVFDDYGSKAYAEVRAGVDQFFEDKPGKLIHFPTSQAIYFN